MGIFGKRRAGPVQRAGLIAFVMRNIRLAWRLLRDPRVSGMTKLIIPVILVAYVVSPADLLHAIPVLGEVDDLAVISLALSLFIRMAPNPVVAEHRAQLEGAPAQ